MQDPTHTPDESGRAAVTRVTRATKRVRVAKVRPITFDELKAAVVSAIASVPAKSDRWEDIGDATRGRLMFLAGYLGNQRPAVQQLLRELAGCVS